MRFFAVLTLALLSGHVFSGPANACGTSQYDSTRVAVAGGSLTEIVYFLGAEKRIVATDVTSNYPPGARDFPSVGYVRNLSTEGILSVKPTLVLGEHDMGPPEVLAQLERANVQVLRVPEEQTAAGILAKIHCVGLALGVDEVAQHRIEGELIPKVEALRARRALEDDTPVAVLLGLRDGVPVAAGRDTSGDGLLKMIGVRNVFSDFSGWKPVSLEAMAKANPQAIVIPSRGVAAAGGLDSVAGHPAIRLTEAGRDGRILAFDGMAMLGFGPRTLDAAIALIEAFKLDSKQVAFVLDRTE
ncbi:MAG: ABC transporter substrate-binding protein [Pseudomonadota bacterium]